MKLKPLFDRVIIKPVEEDTTESGIIMPKSSKEKPCTGVVVATGSGDEKNNMIVSIGDKVLYSKYAGVDFKFENQDLVILKQIDILLVYEKE